MTQDHAQAAVPVLGYRPHEIEDKWQSYWAERGTFSGSTPDLPTKPKFYCLDMFPYPSGSGLHVGHPLGYTATDVYSRYKRMRGFNVLHPMGFDAFGLPAEQHAVATGEHPLGITKQNCELFTKQMKRLGFSYDWDRNLATCDVEYYQWTQWIFLKLYNSWFDVVQNKARPIEELVVPEDVVSRGVLAVQEYQARYRLAFYSEALVNYCPALGTVLANEEVIDGKSERGGFEVIRKPMKQWMLRITTYTERLLGDLEDLDWPENIKEQQRNWIGRREGAQVTFTAASGGTKVTVFTTRPDTLFGVTFLVLAPENPLVDIFVTPEQKGRVSEYCAAAARLSDLSRGLDSRKKTGVWTGGYVVSPVTGELVPVYVADYVLMGYGTGAVMGVPAHDERDFEFARLFNLPIRAAIKPDVEDAELVSNVVDGEDSWSGSGTMLPLSFKEMDELELAGIANQEAGRRIMAWLEGRGNGAVVVQYKLRDWLFSRQRYWGEPIPIVHWEDGRMTVATEAELPLVLPQVQDYRPSDGGESPLAKAEEWLHVVDPVTGVRGRRETNTMPQWAGSCWYYLRFIDPRNPESSWDREKERAWMPVDLYVGGAEHAVLHLLYARFWHKVLFDLGYVSTKEPFQKLFNQGMIVAEAFRNHRGSLVPTDEVEQKTDGSFVHRSTGDILEKIIGKMSKSLRNVVDPLDVVKEYGADTLRTYLMFMGPLDSTRPWDSKAIVGNFRFLKKAWTFVTEQLSQVVAEAQESQEVARLRHLTIKRVTDDIEGLRFNTGISALMECLNGMQGQPVSRETLKVFVLLLAPFAPHIGEELWQRLGASESIADAPWPCYNEELLILDAVTVVIQIQGKKRGTVTLPRDVGELELKQAVVDAMVGTQYQVSVDDTFITVYQKGSRVPKLVNIMV